ncbi:hypothetical protein CAP48_19020 [Advenella sp. S44]|uniref:PDR/VanB family oxidoreductase n=1 Tax=Advenella sp. S44 TaxID=1982755 RepID=UPI000C29BD13|nr:PDR/VanB family oxidoreductase [Advenella sp. S44]PJX20493.1 hypothetical protein CAP48_19020 [Advenella sp. S44]
MNTLKARLHSIEYVASGIHSFEFRPLEGSAWPRFSAGAHIDIHFADELSRSYSLINPEGECHRYVVAINRDEHGKGGSRYLHDTLRVGTCLSISEPRNTFPLNESANHSVFIAGGIGITPLWSMIQRLTQLGSPWTLHYAARERVNAAFVEQLEMLQQPDQSECHLYFDQEPSGRYMDLRSVVGSCPTGAHIYCCGPVRMLEAFEQVVTELHIAQDRVHREYFAVPATPSKMAGHTDQAFNVLLAKSGRSVAVDKDTTILEALLDEGVDVPYSCMSGICGACMTNVLKGEPDHRDLVLTEEEKDSGKVMLICCSRSKSSEIELDL